MSESSLSTLLQVDQRERWQRGEHVPVEAYLDRHPSLRTDPEHLLDLIYNEMMLREDAGIPPQLAEYRGRFPHLGDQIRLLFEVHEVLEVERLEKTNIVRNGTASRIVARAADGSAAAPVQVPGYEILGELGRGGMGVVYKARQTSLGRLVALKMILAGVHASPAQLARFRTEAEAVARLQHPNIVHIYEIEEQEGRPCLSLEFVEGQSLAQKLSASPQPPRQAAKLVEVLARTMHYAHEHGIVHRDLKPSNILLTADGSPKVTDFGLAKILDSADGRTPTEAFLGSPNYMAPEQALGQSKESGPAADVYALGAILYEMLTGRPPFQGSTMLETLELVRWQDPVPPRRLQPRVPRDLEIICLKCLDKEGRRRYATAAALAEDVRRFLAGEPIAGRPASPWRRMTRWARRRPVAATLLGVAAVALAGLAGAYVQAGFRERARLAELRAEVHGPARAGQKAFAAQDWSEARAQLAGVLARIGGEDALQDLRGPLEEMYAEAGRRLRERQARARADSTYQAFLRLRDDALFHGMDSQSPGMLLTGMDARSHRRAAETAARAALARVGLEVERNTPWSPDPRMTEAQRMEVRAGAQVVLLVLADATSLEDSAGQGGCRKALRLVERARQVGAPERACRQRQAEYLERLGDDEAARHERARLAALPAAGDLDHLLNGQAHYRQGRLPQAIREFKKVLVGHPDHFWGRCFLAFCELRLQNWERAWDSLTVCLSRRPDFVWARLLRGYAHRELGAYEDALLDFRQAEQALQRSPNPDASYYLHLNRGLLFRRQGKLGEAAADLETAIRLQPEQYAAHLDLARVHQQQARQTLPATAASVVALLGSPLERHRPVLAASTLLAEEVRARAKGAEQLRQVVRLRPPPLVLADYHAECARDLYLAGRHEEAIRACGLALETQADYPFALGILGQALLDLGRFKEARAAFDRYLAGGGRPVLDVYRGRGRALVQLGDYLAAVDDYTRVLEREPGAEIHAHRGWAYFFADAWRPALRDFEKALVFDRKHADAYTGRGLARVMLGAYREGVHDADEALRLKPAAPEMMHNIACIFALAAGKAAVDPQEKQRDALTRRYRTAAVEALRAALALVPPAARRQFWREKMLPDTALEAIRASPEFRELLREQGS
jgi:tetratricopeptide (TPR) repeat protein